MNEFESETGNLEPATKSAARPVGGGAETGARAASGKRQTRRIVIGCITAFVLIIGGDYGLDMLPVATHGPVTMYVATAPDAIQQHNARSARLLLQERQRANAVIPMGIPPDQVSSVCGPAAIFTAPVKFDPTLAGGSFAEYVRRVKMEGNFSSWGRNGMSRFEISAELKRLGIPNHRVTGWSGAYAATKAVQAIDAGHLVLLRVNSARSYTAITGARFPGTGGEHVIRAISTHWDAAGRIDGVALYDVNVYNGSALPGLDQRPVTYVSYADFVRLLQVQMVPSSRLIISDQPIFN